MSKLVIKANKKDKYRSLLTDTSPYEVPLLFSNDGFYEEIKNIKKENKFKRSLVENMLDGNVKYTIPYTYNINKAPKGIRRLSLIHPASQLEYSNFYHAKANLIAHYCRESETSIRSPNKIGNIYYISGFSDTINKYRSNKIDTLRDDLLSKYTTSYFSYSGYNRLYQFYRSPDFLKLEQKFSRMATIDISKCFDSIYTHSISWATKSKEFAKNNLRRSMFADEFDRTIQKSNYSETNGIPIGAEVSRIFAEIILESIDKETIEELSNHKVYFKKDYAIRRYVDDIHIFTNTEETHNLVISCLTETLSKYKLSLNEQKTQIINRPFYTARSSVMSETSDLLNRFFQSFIDKNNESNFFKPLQIRRPHNLKSDFIARMKGICYSHEQPYEAASAYIISSIFNQIKFLIEGFENPKTDNEKGLYRLCFSLLIDLAFYFYLVGPTVSSSYNLGKIIILSSRFFKIELPDESYSINQLLYEKTVSVIKSSSISDNPFSEDHIKLEKLNIFLSSVELGKDHLLPEAFIIKHLLPRDNISPNYFEIISILFYTRNNQQFNKIRKIIIKSIDIKLSNIENCKISSENAHLLLDTLSCPFLNEADRKNLMLQYLNSYKLPTPSSDTETTSAIQSFTKGHWFVNWKEVDLYNAIEKKELKMAYR